MTQFKNLLEVLKILPKTNCRKCNEKTCMAFAAAVFKGEKALSVCPYVEPEILRQYKDQNSPSQSSTPQEEMEKALAALKSSLNEIDFTEAAARIGGRYESEKLTVKVMGKDFTVDGNGVIYTDIHANPWVTMPILHYITHCKGVPPTGNWVSMRELPGGKDWYHFFSKQCEDRMKKLADKYPDLFEDLVHIFDGKTIDFHYQSDIAVVLRPLPLVPMLVSYMRPEEGMDSKLTLLFDGTAEDNLGSHGIYTLGTGIVRMFEKLALRHGIS